VQKFFSLSLAVALAMTGASAAQAASLSQGFDNITTLAGQGWVLQNNSNPVGATGWLQGNPSTFSSQSGAANSYIAANFFNTGANGTISNWLLTPTLTFNNGDVLTFFTRTVDAPTAPDNLEVRFSSAGSSANVGTTETSVGDFTTLLIAINSGLTTTGYPSVWTQFTATITGLSAPTDGRVAFRYFVPNGGLLGSNSDYIGIDSVTVVPEPSGVAGLLFGSIGIAGFALKRAKKKAA
jgi:hypothetical protein